MKKLNNTKKIDSWYKCTKCNCGWSEEFAKSKSYICGDRPDVRQKHCHGILVIQSQWAEMNKDDAASMEVEALNEIFLETYDIQSVI